MSLPTRLRPSLIARREWCAPDEPIWWALRARGVTYRVEGLDEDGKPKPGVGRRLAGAAGKAGALVALGGLAMVLGGDGNSGDRGEPRRRKSPSAVPDKDLVVFGPRRDCELLRRAREQLAPSEVIVVLTPRRLGLLAPVDDPDAPGQGWKQLGRGWGEVGRSLIGAGAGFGPNSAGSPMRSERVVPWLEFSPGDLADCGFSDPVRLGFLLRDGSGIAVRVLADADAGMVADSVRAFAAGRPWRPA